MKKHSRRYREIQDQIPANHSFSLMEGLNFLQKNNREKCQDIRISLSLNRANQKSILASKIILPYPVIKARKIAIIKDNLPEDILNNLPPDPNIELLTIAELEERITGRKKTQWGFIKLLAHPDSEKKIKPLEKILAPKSLYPNQKNGNLTENIAEEISKFQAGEKAIKADKAGNLQMVMGRTDFTPEQLETNYNNIYNKIIALRPGNWKGKFVNRITLSTTMGPGIRIIV